MPDYKNGKIYKITANDDKLIYIGCTCGSLKLRFNAHKSKAKTSKCIKSYRVSILTSFQLFEYDDVKIELIENYPCDNKRDLLLRERDYMEKYECVNKHRAIRYEAEKLE
jgi:hypothetical protein